ncbi:AMP-binding protein [Streptomyces naganishii]|uniref:AMP-binding protein n=1 Tax=Streptomyces naganishii TaxID=285447 RepID=UPI00167D1BCB|nr:AMP-binding protein [Streptomyces naganishii]
MADRLDRVSTWAGEGVHALVEGHARTRPDAAAVICGHRTVTYRALNEEADKVAARLTRVGLPPEAVVAVLLDRGTSVPAAVLGVLKAGAAYLALEPTAPAATLRRLLADADPIAVVTSERHLVTLEGAGAHARTVLLDEPGEERPEPGVGGPEDLAATAPRAVSATTPACLLYTAASGGDAAPRRGVVVDHAALLDAYHDWQWLYELTPQDRHLQSAAVDFAGFTADWIRALGSGGTLVMAEHADAQDPRNASRLHRLITQERITVLQCDTGTARDLTEHLRAEEVDLAAVRLMSIAGDVWYLDEQYDLRLLAGPHVRLLNTYGLTEAIGDGANHEVPARPTPAREAWFTAPIGAPLPGVSLAVTGAGGASLPPGLVGEITVGGRNTASRRLHGEPLGSRQGTDDLGMLRADGSLVFVGRRGAYSEVEAVLRGHAQVRHCLVSEVAEDDGRWGELVAYVVPVGDTQVETTEVQAYLQGLVAPEQIPHRVVCVPALPRTRSGRTDRGATPRPARPGTGRPRSSKIPRPRAGQVRRFPATRSSGGWFLLAAFVGSLFALTTTQALWPGSTDLSGVPGPWSLFFAVLYLFEDVAFGLGLGFLVIGRRALRRRGLEGPSAWILQLSVVWLLASWWPQDNLYRLAAKNDWPRQAALVYLFNVPLMIAGAVVIVFIASLPARTRRARAQLAQPENASASAELERTSSASAASSASPERAARATPR